MDNMFGAAKPNNLVVVTPNTLKAAIDLQEKANWEWNETFNKVPALVDQVDVLTDRVDTLASLLSELVVQLRELAGKVGEVANQAH